MLPYRIGELKNKDVDIDLFTRWAICILFPLTVFEPYINGFFGSIVKYYIVFLLLLILYKHKWVIHLKVNSIVIPLVIWIMYQTISIMWSKNRAAPKLYFLTELTSIILIFLIVEYGLDKKTIDWMTVSYWISSGVLGIFSLLFSYSYHSVVTTRQVLVLFGVENDPNNQAAFLLVGSCISLVFLLYENRNQILSLIILFVNTYACFRTGSRAALIGTGAIVLICFFTSDRKDAFALIKKLVILFAGFLLMTYLSTRFLSKDSFVRLFSFDTYYGGSGRIMMWNRAWKLFTKDLLSVIFGTGWGTILEYSGTTGGIHNTFLTMLCDVGIFGFSFFLYPILKASVFLYERKTILPFMLCWVQMIPSFFIDANNKRFFWNSIMIMLIYYNYMVNCELGSNELGNVRYNLTTNVTVIHREEFS